MIVEFAARVYVVDPSHEDRVKLRVVRRGRTHKKVMFRYETLNGTAKKNTHYLPKGETLVFQPGETEKLFSVDLVNEGGEWKEKDLFYVKLELDPTITDERIRIGQSSPAEIVYLPKEPEAVTVEFVKDHAVVRENEGVVRLAVVRKGSVKVSGPRSLAWPVQMWKAKFTGVAYRRSFCAVGKNDGRESMSFVFVA